MPHAHSTDARDRRRRRAILNGFIHVPADITDRCQAACDSLVPCQLLGEDVCNANVAATKVKDIIGQKSYNQARALHRPAGRAKHAGMSRSDCQVISLDSLITNMHASPLSSDGESHGSFQSSTVDGSPCPDSFYIGEQICTTAVQTDVFMALPISIHGDHETSPVRSIIDTVCDTSMHVYNITACFARISDLSLEPLVPYESTLEPTSEDDIDTVVAVFNDHLRSFQSAWKQHSEALAAILSYDDARDSDVLGDNYGNSEDLLSFVEREGLSFDFSEGMLHLVGSYALSCAIRIPSVSIWFTKLTTTWC